MCRLELSLEVEERTQFILKRNIQLPNHDWAILKRPIPFSSMYNYGHNFNALMKDKYFLF